MAHRELQTPQRFAGTHGVKLRTRLLLTVLSLTLALGLPGQPATVSAHPLASHVPKATTLVDARPTPQISEPLRDDRMPALRAARLAAGRMVGPQPTSQPRPAPAAPQYVGHDHFWFPALGINATVTWYACSRSDYPAPIVYRWGCAGTNNVYLFGHAANAFSAVYRAFYAGTLKVGQVLIYADHAGVIHRYQLSIARLEDGRIASDYRWAVGDQPVPSLTLQTCSKVVGIDIEVRAIEIR